MSFICWLPATIIVVCLIVRVTDIPFLAVSVKEYGVHAFTGGKDQVKNYETIEFQLLGSQGARPFPVNELDASSLMCECAMRKRVSDMPIV